MKKLGDGGVPCAAGTPSSELDESCRVGLRDAPPGSISETEMDHRCATPRETMQSERTEHALGALANFGSRKISRQKVCQS